MNPFRPQLGLKSSLSILFAFGLLLLLPSSRAVEPADLFAAKEIIDIIGETLPKLRRKDPSKPVLEAIQAYFERQQTVTKIRLPERGQDWLNCTTEHKATSLEIDRPDLFDRCFCDKKISISMTPACDAPTLNTVPEIIREPFDYLSDEGREAMANAVLGDIDGYRYGGKEHSEFIWARVRQNSPLGDKIVANETELK